MRLLLLSCALLLATSIPAHADSNAVDDSREPRLAVATDPIGLLGGRYALSASYVTARRAAVRADVEVRDELAGFPGSDEWRASISVPIYLDRPLRGPYVEPGLALANRVSAYAVVGIGTLGGGSGSLGGLTMTPTYIPQHTRSVEPQMFVGWQWLFRSNLHLAAAVGVSRRLSFERSSTFAVPESYVRIGVAL